MAATNEGLPKTRAALARFFDHTLLKPDATVAQVEALCSEALEYNFIGVCVNSGYLPRVVERLSGSDSLPVAVLGFPLGACATSVKEAEVRYCLEAGALELDTVVPVGAYLGGEEAYVRKDLQAVCQAAGTVPVKVILETAFLTPDQITELTRWSVEAGAAFVKTSTGFASRGASVEDCQIMSQTLQGLGCAERVGIKASGGIRDLPGAQAMIAAGATRIGASASVDILKALPE